MASGAAEVSRTCPWCLAKLWAGLSEPLYSGAIVPEQAQSVAHVETIRREALANGPQDYRDPKVTTTTTTTTQSSPMKWLWYALGALLVLLLLGWLLGLFSGNDDEAAVTADPAAATDTEAGSATEAPAN